jgi:hypothetical protein
MPDVLEFLLYVVAFICFLIASFAPERVSRVNLIGLGLAAWVLVPLANSWPG